MVDFVEEMSQDFLDYCYQTNAERAFPAIDGLKPGQRACLYEMYRKNYLPTKPHVKSAKVDGGVVAELWPHGNTAIYETFARMAQPFTNNVPLCEFHGSCGNQIIPEPAADRYTEVRLSKMGLSMFEGIKKKNVPFILNFDETLEWPEILPSTLPWLMINGSEGIGTTISQHWLCYDLAEVSNAYKQYLIEGTLDYTLAPSFPSGGTIINKNDLPTILKTGKGKVILRAKASINKNVISITEICYQTCVRDLMEEFKKLYEADELEGVEDIQNVSGKKGINIQIICEKNANPDKVLNMLYRKTNLQKSYSANQNILIDKIPQMVNMEQYFQLLKKHNESCLIKECEFDFNKDMKRKEECEGLIIAIADIDNIINIVRNSEDKTTAQIALIKKYNFTELQANTILKMTIGQLTKLDGNKIEKELETLKGEIKRLKFIMNNESEQLKIIVDRIENLVKTYKGKRTTEVTQIDITPEAKEIEAITPEDVVVVLSRTGEIKRVPAKSFKVQRKNGKGAKSADDAILDIISTNTIDTLMLFTNKGRMFRMLVDTIPSTTNTGKGVRVGSLISLESNESVMAITSLYRKSTAKYVVFFTKNGTIKKTALEEYTKMKKSTGVPAIKLADGDAIANVTFLNDEEVILLTKGGMAIHFNTDSIAAIGRVTIGVRAIKLMDGDEVLVGLPIHKSTDCVAVFTQDGMAKKMRIQDFTLQARGGKGVKYCKVDDIIVGAAMVSDEDNLLLIGKPNTICISAKDIPAYDRLAGGNVMIKNSTINSIVKL